MPPIARSICDSIGNLFDNVAQASEVVGLKSTSSIYGAAFATSFGAYKIAAGRQWAFVGEAPDQWPVKPMGPVKPLRVPSRSKSSLPADTSSEAIFPPKLTGVEWRAVPGLPDYEVSNRCQVRLVLVPEFLLEDRYHGKVSVVVIDGYSYKCLDLMCHAFMGFIPYGFVLRQKRFGCERLQNLFYEPRKPCKQEDVE